jgi:hypothetical protein
MDVVSIAQGTVDVGSTSSITHASVRGNRRLSVWRGFYGLETDNQHPED